MVNGSKTLVRLSVIIVILAAISSSIGLLWNSGEGPFSFTNLHGETLEMYGKGLYKYDTFFKAPIYRGTDAVIFFVAVPLFMYSIFLYRSGTLRGQMLILSTITCFLYYSTSLVFGVAYNQLFLIYLLFFSASLFAFIIGFMTINIKEIPSKILSSFPHRGIIIFLTVSGFSLFVWFIDIIQSLLTGNVPQGVASYTTEITYVLDLAIISPACFVASKLLKKRSALAYPIASCLLVLCGLIGIIVVSQTIAQYLEGITLNPVQLIAFVGVFVCLSGFAITFTIKFYRNIKN